MLEKRRSNRSEEHITNCSEACKCHADSHKRIALATRFLPAIGTAAVRLLEAATAASTNVQCRPYPNLRPLLRPAAGHFTPLREKRCISSSGRSPLEPYRSDLTY